MDDLQQLAERLTGALAPSYTIGAHLGSGGCAAVFAARDNRLARDVAIKVLKPELDAGSLRERFRREGATAGRLSHPSILAVHDVGEGNGLAWMVMPLVRGESARAKLERDGVWPVDEVRQLLIAMADALAAAHEAGVLHRDVKPDNILLDGATRRPMLADFGVAKAIADEASRLTTVGIAVGTPAYMSPEQLAADGPLDARADVWALGLVGHELLTGQHPFAGSSMPKMIGRILSDTPTAMSTVRSDVPAWLEGVLARCLEKETDDRWPSASALRDALRAGVRPRPSRATGRQSSGVGAMGPIPAVPLAAWQRPALEGLGVSAAAGVLEWGITRSIVVAPVIALLAAARVAIVASNAKRAAWAGDGRASEDPAAALVHAMRTDRRIASAILMQLPRVRREKCEDVLPALDVALASAEALGARDLASLRALAAQAHAVRSALEGGALDTVSDAAFQLVSLATPAR